MARTYETDEELRQLAGICDERGIPKQCQSCGRSFAGCRQYDDLPMTMRKGLPLCNACYPPTGGADEMGTRIKWTRPQAGSKVPLYLEVLEMRDAGLTLPEISKELRERYEIEVDSGALRKALERYAEGKPRERSNDQVAWGEPMEGSDRPLWEEAKAIKEAGLTWKETAEELGSRYGISVVPGTVSGMVLYYGKKTAGTTVASGEKKQRASRAGTAGTKVASSEQQQTRMTKPSLATRHSQLGTAGEACPCLLHVARDGFEVWISGRDEGEFLVKLEAAQNLLAMAVNG